MKTKTEIRVVEVPQKLTLEQTGKCISSFNNRFCDSSFWFRLQWSWMLLFNPKKLKKINNDAHKEALAISQFKRTMFELIDTLTSQIEKMEEQEEED